MFSDLVGFIERQVMILSLFGDIQDSKQTSTVKTSATVKSKERSSPKSNFATTVTPISAVETNGEKTNAPISHNPCLFCKNTANILQMGGNQTCKQNQIPSFIHSFIPKCSCYSDRSNPDGLQYIVTSPYMFIRKVKFHIV